MKTLTRTAVVAMGIMALAASAPAFAADCPIKLGGIAPLSAPGAVTGGEAQRVGMQIAAEGINAAGGVLGCEVELIIGDTEGLPEKGMALFEKMISQDNVAAIAGGYHSSVGIAGKEVAHDKGVPVVFASTLERPDHRQQTARDLQNSAVEFRSLGALLEVCGKHS